MGEFRLEIRFSETEILDRAVRELQELPQRAGLERTGELVSRLLADERLRAMLDAANTLLVRYLKYNDHGWYHAIITARNALKILLILHECGIEPNLVSHGLGTLDDSAFVTVLAAFLHDVGNMVHRELHWLHGVYIASPLVWEYINVLYPDADVSKRWLLYAHVANAIYSHDEKVQAFTIEASCVKVGDGADIMGGRSRRPYDLGKIDIHSISALSIREVEIEKGVERPVMIRVDMIDPAGVFQVEEVLLPKIKTSLLRDLVEIRVTVNGRPIKLSRIVT